MIQHHQLLTKSQRRKTFGIQLDRITELTWNPELTTEVAIQIQDKFKPDIQDT